MKTTSTQSLHRLMQAALIAALYATLTLVLPVTSFGPVQFRLGEALTVLAVYGMPSVAGLTLGCAVANAVGVAMGANIAGVWDVLIGTAATFAAAWTGYLLRRITVKGFPLVSAFLPVLFNAAAVGWLLSETVMNGDAFWLMAAEVGAGELVPCLAGGAFLYGMLEKTGISARFFNKG